MKQGLYTRQELYQLVWKEPLSAIAKRLNVSVAGLRNTCVRLKIPLPYRGYWSQVRFGTTTIIPELPDINESAPISFLEIDMSHLQLDSKRSRLLVLQKQIIQKQSKLLKVPKRLTNPEKEIKECVEWYKKDKVKPREGFLQFGGNKLSMKITKTHLNRAFCLMNTFIKILKARGHKIKFQYGDTCAVIFGQSIEIYLREKLKRTETGKDYPMYDFTPCGLFVLAIDKWGGKREYVDGKQKLEEMLPKIIASMEIQAEEERQWKIKNEKRQKIREEREKEHIALERKKEKELTDFKALLISSERWHKAENLRHFIDKMEKSFVNRNSALDEWLEWARRKADWYDPFIEAKDSLMEDVDREQLTRSPKPFSC